MRIETVYKKLKSGERKTISKTRKKKNSVGGRKKAPIRIELMNKGFADLSLTTWARRR